jgi:hypothetical protein
LKPSENTHLIAREGKGPKFEVAASANMFIVQAKWLEECRKQRLRVDERLHRVDNVSHKDSNEETHAPESIQPVATDAQRQSNNIESEANLQESLGSILASGIDCPSALFSAWHFYFAGFSDDDRSLRNQLGNLLRRGLGTIHWDFHEGITHVIVRDGSDKSLG